MNAKTPLLTITKLQQNVGARRLLDIANLSIGCGDCIVLSGDNGSGKTTFMKSLAGLERADHLVIDVGNQQLESRAARKWLRARSVYLHQQAYMFDRTVRQNISYGLVHGQCKVKGVTDRRNSKKDNASTIDEQVTRALNWSGLAPLADRNARHLSGGEKQRVALTRARIVEPVLLLLDEPTGGLDRRSQAQTYKMINQLSDEGMTIVVSTHDNLDRFSFANAFWNISNQNIEVSPATIAGSI